MSNNPILTPAQFRMAKAAFGVSNPQVKLLTGLHRNTLNKADKGEASDATWALLRRTFENLDCIFLDANDDGPAGVRFDGAHPQRKVRAHAYDWKNDPLNYRSDG